MKGVIPSGKKAPDIVLGCVIVVLTLLLSGCNEQGIRQLGAKLAISGQRASDSAVRALTNIDDLEAIDFQQRAIAKTVSLPPKLLETPAPDINNLIAVKRNDELSNEIATRIKAYKLFGKAYAALQRLSETPFADQTATAEGNLINAFNAVKGLPKVPASVTSLIPDISRIIINRKQAKDIKKANLLLYQLCQFSKPFWYPTRIVSAHLMTAADPSY